MYTLHNIQMNSIKTAQLPLYISEVGPNQGWTAHARWEDRSHLNRFQRGVCINDEWKWGAHTEHGHGFHAPP